MRCVHSGHFSATRGAPQVALNYRDVLTCGYDKLGTKVATMDAESIDTGALREAIANQMRLLRTARRWSQDDLAMHARISRRSIQRLEKCEIAMDIKHMQGLGEAFEMSWFEFMRLVYTEAQAAQGRKKPQTD